MRLRRGFAIEAGEAVLVVEDVVTTGSSAREVYELVGETGANRLGVAALIDRSTQDVGFPLRSVLRVDAQTWRPQDCPLCRRGEPLTARGSRLLGATNPAASPKGSGG